MIYTLPFIAALIGWVTNFIAIKMLFHPRKPIKLLFFTLQGIFPKRQQALAQKIGALVANELFSIQDIKKSLITDKNLEGVNELIDQKIEHFLREKLVKTMPMLAMFMNDTIVNTIKATLLAEFNEVLPEVISNYADKLEESIDIQKTVEDKVAAFSFEKLEDILFSILKKEFKFIELIGAILGFLIGLLQIGLIHFSA